MQFWQVNHYLSGVYSISSLIFEMSPCHILSGKTDRIVRALLSARSADKSFNDLVRAPALFPFALPVTPADLHQSPCFQVHQAGQEITMIACESIREPTNEPPLFK